MLLQLFRVTRIAIRQSNTVTFIHSAYFFHVIIINFKREIKIFSYSTFIIEFVNIFLCLFLKFFLESFSFMDLMFS